MKAAALFIFALLALAVCVQAECDDACANGYAAFKRWCFSLGRTARCMALVNAPDQFNTQACLAYCPH